MSEHAGTELRDAQIQELLIEGLASGEDIPMTDQFWKSLRDEALRMAD